MADRIVFHFNKASAGEPSIPPWVVKCRGQTHTVWHLDSAIGFSTKETPESAHTKGSIQFRGRLDLHEVDGRLHARVSADPILFSGQPDPHKAGGHLHATVTGDSAS